MAQESGVNCLNVKASDCPITKVTVYIDRAEVCRNYEGTITAGTNELHITHFVEADEDSIRVEGQGKATIAEVSFQRNQKADKETSKSEEEKALEEELKNLQKELKDNQFESKLNGLKKQKEILDKFATTSSSARQGESRESLLTQEYFQGIRDFLHQYKDIDQGLEGEKFDIEGKREELSTKIQDVKTKLEQLSKERNAAKEKKECIIVLEAEEETKVNLSISYIVFRASWTPLYDLRMFTDQGNLKIIYYGMISQESGEDWKNVKMSLSTAEPVLGGSIPILPQKQLYVAVPRIGRMGSFKKAIRTRRPLMQNAMIDDRVENFCYDESSFDVECYEPVALNIDPMKVTEGLTSATYEIARLSTIPSDNSPHKVSVAIIETKPTLSYITVPSKVPHAFLEAKVTNTSPYILLPGPTNIFMDNTSVGKAHLKAVAPKEEFECSLGVDPGVRVGYKPASEVASSSGLISKWKVTHHKQVMEIKNTHANEIKVKVRENLPKSKNEKIRIKLLDPPIDMKKQEKTAKDVTLTEENHVEWDISIPSMEKAEVSLIYTVEHPSDVRIETDEVIGFK